MEGEMEGWKKECGYRENWERCGICENLSRNGRCLMSGYKVSTSLGRCDDFWPKRKVDQLRLMLEYGSISVQQYIAEKMKLNRTNEKKAR